MELMNHKPLKQAVLLGLRLKAAKVFNIAQLRDALETLDRVAQQLSLSTVVLRIKVHRNDSG